MAFVLLTSRKKKEWGTQCGELIGRRIITPLYFFLPRGIPSLSLIFGIKHFNQAIENEQLFVPKWEES